jgi:cell division protein ZapA (FtsZ GTPase activity inhibitor)
VHHHVVTILQKNYSISCSEEEIARLEECTNFVNAILQKITKSGRINSENTVMAMALLTITDELLDLKKDNTSNYTLDKPKNTLTQNIIPENIVSKLEKLCQKMEIQK